MGHEKQKTKKDFPQDVSKQLWGSISAVFLSWNSKRAKTYSYNYGWKWPMGKIK